MQTIVLVSPYWKEEHRWMVSTVKLAELWQRLGYRIVVVCMGTTQNGVAEEMEQISPTLVIHRVRDWFLPDPWNYGIALRFTRIVKRVVREERPAHIVVNKILFWSSLSVCSLRLAGYPVILLTDALVGITWWGRTWLFRLCSRIYAWTLGWVILRAATRVVFFHPQPPPILALLGITAKSRVIPTGIDASRYNRNERTPNTLVIRYVGRLESVKGVDDFVRAAMEVKKIHPEVHVQVVGWYRDGHPLVREYGGHITFTGLRNDIPSLLADTDIFVLPSHAEGLSNALMEAMASGCACIASDVGGNAFLIQNGISGFLFPAGDHHALSSHMLRLIEDRHKRESLGQAAQERIRKHFDWQRISAQYERLFQECTQ